MGTLSSEAKCVQTNDHFSNYCFTLDPYWGREGPDDLPADCELSNKCPICERISVFDLAHPCGK